MHTAAATAAIRNAWVKIDKARHTVDRDSIPISKSREEEVEWYSRDDEAFSIVFDKGKSPFQSEQFHIPHGGSVCSGPAVKGVLDKSYKYTVLDSNGGMVVDPQVVIKA